MCYITCPDVAITIEKWGYKCLYLL
jgi:hypothetical protein